MDVILEKLLFAWIPLFVAMDPIGLVPIFLGITEEVEAEHHRKIVYQATWTAGVIAIGFIFIGKFIFRALGITVSDFQIAGGLILFTLASRDLVAASQRAALFCEDFGVVPLGTPLIAGPATLTTLLILIDSVGMGFALLGFLLNLLLVLIAFLYSPQLARRIGIRGLRAFSKIVSLLLAAIGVSMIRRGLQGM